MLTSPGTTVSTGTFPLVKDRVALLARYGGFALSVVTFVLGIAWAFAIKPFNAPDEPMHLQAVMQMRKGYGLPEVHYDMSVRPKGSIVDTYIDQPSWDYAISQGITQSYKLEPNQSIQPPLYYGLVALASAFTPPDPPLVFYIGRLVSVLLGVAIVFFCWATIRELFPTQPRFALLASGLLVLLPQFSFLRASLSNDNAVILAGAASFYLWVRALRHPDFDPWMWKAGAVLGLGLLAKLTATALLPGLALVILFRAFQQPPNASRTADSPALLWRRRILRALRMSIGSGAALLLIYGWYLVRNLLVYNDLLGLGNARLYNGARLPLFDMSDPGVRTIFINWTWETFIGRYGWLDVLYPHAVYGIMSGLFALLAALTIFVTARALLRSAQAHKTIPQPTQDSPAPAGPIPTYIRQFFAVIMLVAAAVIYNYINYSLTFNFQPQARHTFLLLLPYALLFTGGLYVLTRRSRISTLLTSLPLLALAVLNLTGIYMVAAYTQLIW
ncbi:MAG: glycosyltransferase family 39 protein [Chloroflexia bacterium]